MADLTTYGSRGAIEPKHDWSSQTGLNSSGWRGAIEPTSAVAGGATGKSNPLYGCLGGCLRGQIG